MHRARVPTRFRSRRVPCNSAPRVGEKLVSHSKGGGDETATTATRNSPVVRSKLTKAKETHPVPNNGHGRVMCYRCRRVERLCVCGLVRDIVGSDDKIFTKMHVTVLQDRIEALSRPFGSAIVCELALENCTSVWYDTKVPENVPRRYRELTLMVSYSFSNKMTKQSHGKMGVDVSGSLFGRLAQSYC